jgi:desulfoferrodoxin (superoxide reductase-like protein)
MKQFNILLFVIVLLITYVCASGPAFADKASITIDVPTVAAKGSEITIKVTVIHSTNNFFHHVEWVYVKINGKEVARWDFSGSKKPENTTFAREIKFQANEPLEISAEASCNMHGSKGPAMVNISIK